MQHNTESQKDKKRGRVQEAADDHGVLSQESRASLLMHCQLGPRDSLLKHT